MDLTIRQKADTVATFRFIAVEAMEMLARWVPTTPELEAKVLFGRHIWDMAQHADALGRRTHELRAAVHYTLPAREPYREALRAVAEATGTAERVGLFYGALLPDVESRYRQYLAEADPLLDEPTLRILESFLAQVPRLLSDRDGLGTERPDLVPGDAGAVRQAARALAAQQDIVDFRPAPPARSAPAGMP